MRPLTHRHHHEFFSEAMIPLLLQPLAVQTLLVELLEQQSLYPLGHSASWREYVTERSFLTCGLAPGLIPQAFPRFLELYVSAGVHELGLLGVVSGASTAFTTRYLWLRSYEGPKASFEDVYDLAEYLRTPPHWSRHT